MSEVTLKGQNTLSGRLDIVSSKSELHRILICASLCGEKCKIHYVSSLSEDIMATISCLNALGAVIKLSENVIEIIEPVKKTNERAKLFCNESGSTARFLLPLATLFCSEETVIDGGGKLPERPFSDLCKSLEKQGATFSSYNLPITVTKPLNDGGCFEISGNISSQYLSGLLFILPFLPNSSIRLTTPLKSAGYVDLTIDIMKKFGIDVTENGGLYTVSGKYTLYDKNIYVNGDWSNAAFFLCTLKEQGCVCIGGLKARSLQRDRKIIDILNGAGFEIEQNNGIISVHRGKNVHSFTADCSDTPDIVPPLAVLAASICGRSVISNISRLKFKESNRIKSVCDMIASLGGKISSDENSIYIDGTGSLCGGKVCGYNDHRIVMSAAIASCISEKDVTITDSDAVNKSYPDFFKIFNSLVG